MRQQPFTWQLLMLAIGLTGLAIFYYEPWLTLQSKTRNQPMNEDLSSVEHTHLVLGAAAGEGLAGRLQCKGLMATMETSRVAASNGTCLLRNNSRASFVTFFVHHSEDSPIDKDEQSVQPDSIDSGNINSKKQDRPYTILGIFLESVKMSMPGSMATILTDQDSLIIARRLPMDVTIHRMHGNFSRENLMLQRMQSYITFLETSLLAAKKKYLKDEEAIEEHIIFTDSDIILVGDLGCIFESHSDFDMVLTFRNNKNQPINSGVIMVRGNIESMSRAKCFLDEVLKVYKGRFMKSTKMLGDQLSLAAVVVDSSNISSLHFKKPTSFVLDVLKTKVFFVPSMLYNWTPSEGAGQFHGMPVDVKVLHFKGSRKRLMIEAWRFLKKSQMSLSDMKCLILRSGRTKYDF